MCFNFVIFGDILTMIYISINIVQISYIVYEILESDKS